MEIKALGLWKNNRAKRTSSSLLTQNGLLGSFYTRPTLGGVTTVPSRRERRLEELIFSSSVSV